MEKERIHPGAQKKAERQSTEELNPRVTESGLIPRRGKIDLFFKPRGRSKKEKGGHEDLKVPLQLPRGKSVEDKRTSGEERKELIAYREMKNGKGWRAS